MAVEAKFVKSGRHYYDESGGRASTYVSELHLLFPFRARVDSMSAEISSCC